MINRRDILKAAGLGALAAGIPGVAFARIETQARFVLVLLRGAVDGLAIAAPYGDGHYRRARGELAIAAPGAQGGLLKLDELFGLNPAMPGFFDEFQAGRAAVVHAIASPYRERSHFDGQDVLENGATDAGSRRDGWLNRALRALGGSLDNAVAIAMAQNTPLVLRGDNPVTSWAPSRLPDIGENTLERLQDLYAGDEFFATRLAEALKSRAIAGEYAGMDERHRPGNDAEQTRETMQAAARFLATPEGPRIAVMEAGGWDTHANQGTVGGTLFNRLKLLDDGLRELRLGLGAHWSETVVAVVTEFGRTVAVNGTRGTDHGTASAALLLGGAVAGGRVIADWPGLRATDLYENRDLKPTTDMRSLFKGILAQHLLLPESLLEGEVFPGSNAAKPMRDIIRG